MKPPLRQFVLISPTLGDVVLRKVHHWDHVKEYLADYGYVNMGKVKVVEREYHWVSDTPQLIDTDKDY